MPLPDDRTPWTEEENDALAEAYVDMARRLGRGEAVSKQQVYQQLAARFGRSVRIYQRKFCSLSCVADGLGLRWIPGLTPLRKLGVATTEAFEKRLLALDYTAVAATLPAPSGGEQ